MGQRPNRAASALQWLQTPVSAGRCTASLLVFITLALLAADLVLLRHNRTLERALQESQRSLYPQLGTQISSLAGTASDGSALEFRPGGGARDTLLFLYSTECPICDLNWPFWEHLARSPDTNKYRIVYANIAGAMTDAYSQSHYFLPDAPVFATIDPRHKEAYRLSVSPALFVVGTDGVVKRLWLGRSDDDDKAKIISTLAASAR